LIRAFQVSLSIIGNATQLTPQKQQSDNSQVTSSNDLESKEVELKKNNNSLSTKKISSILTSPSFKKKAPLPKSSSVKESSNPKLNVNGKRTYNNNKYNNCPFSS
jgi:hypothetical protein